MSICLKNLVNFLAYVMPVVNGFLSIGKTGRVVSKVSDSLYLFYDWKCSVLFFNSQVNVFPLGNMIPCLVRKQAETSLTH